MKIASLFSGCGGFDLGFRQAGCHLIWANENARPIVPTLRANFPEATIDTRSITDVPATDIPAVDGIIGGPPCQSWSSARGVRTSGASDPRGQLFWDYVRIVKAVQPKFFVAENVPGMLTKKNSKSFQSLLLDLADCGYVITWQMLMAADYGVPQIRKRLFIVGLRLPRKDDALFFHFPAPLMEYIRRPRTLRDAIWDLRDAPRGVNGHDRGPMHQHRLPPQFMEQDRVSSWDAPSHTIPAYQDYIRFHPSAPAMVRNGKKYDFPPSQKHLFYRLSVRECARLQSFPDDFQFIYKSTSAGYRMVGNAVPPLLAKHLASAIMAKLA